MEEKFFSFFAASVVQSKLWFSNRNFNGLFQIDLKTLKMKFVTFFTKEDILKTKMHRMSIIYGQKIVFLPDQGSYIHIYDTKKNEMKEIPLVRYSSKASLLICDAVLKDNKLWIFPTILEQPLLELDLESYELKEVWKFNKWCLQNLRVKKTIVFARAVLQNGAIWLAVGYTNLVIKWNLKTQTTEKYNTGVGDLFGVFKSENGLWLSTVSHSNIVLWNPVNGRKKVYQISQRTKEKTTMFSQIIEINSQVYVIPSEAPNILCLNCHTNCFESTIDYPEGFKFIQNRVEPKFFGYQIVENKLWLFPAGGNGILLIDIDFNIIDNICLPINNLEFDWELYKSMTNEALRTGPIGESKCFSLSIFCQWLEETKKKIFVESDKKCDFGKLIYSELKTIMSRM